MSSEPNVLEPIKTPYKLNFLDDQQVETCKKRPSEFSKPFMLSVRESKMHSKTPDILAYSTTKDGKDVIFRLGTLTCKGALPTGVAPAITAVWLAEGSR